MIKNQPTVILIDDDESIRNSLTFLLQSAGYNVKTFASANEFLESDLDLEGPVCLVSDIKMPGLNGLEFQKELERRHILIPMIFITGHGDIPMSVQAMKGGAIDFLAKPFDDDKLLHAVEEALKKETEDRAHEGELEHIKQRISFLTERERETLTYLITGMLNKQIAYELSISERTVKAHRKQVFEKMEIHSIAELVRLTEKIGIYPAKKGSW